MCSSPSFSTHPHLNRQLEEVTTTRNSPVGPHSKFHSLHLQSKLSGLPILPHWEGWNVNNLLLISNYLLGFPGGSAVKNLLAKPETRVWSLGREDPLKKEMENTGVFSSIHAWEIPWTEEPDGLQSMGSQRVGHDLVTNHHHHHQQSFIMLYVRRENLQLCLRCFRMSVFRVGEWFTLHICIIWTFCSGQSVKSNLFDFHE